MLWAESSLLPAELRVTFACINEKDSLSGVEILFVPLRVTNEKDLLSKVRILFTSLRSVNEKDLLSKVFFRGIDEA